MLSSQYMLTRSNLQVLRHIYAFTAHYHVWPSLTDIAKRLHRDPKTVHYHIQRLHTHGLTTLHKASWQSGWTLTPQAYELLAKPPLYISHNAPHRKIRNSVGKLIWHNRQQNLRKRLLSQASDQSILTEPAIQSNTNASQPYTCTELSVGDLPLVEG